MSVDTEELASVGLLVCGDTAPECYGRFITGKDGAQQALKQVVKDWYVHLILIFDSSSSSMRFLDGRSIHLFLGRFAPFFGSVADCMKNVHGGNGSETLNSIVATQPTGRRA